MARPPAAARGRVPATVALAALPAVVVAVVWVLVAQTVSPPPLTAPAPAMAPVAATSGAAPAAAPMADAGLAAYVSASPAWVERVAAATGIPARALAAYAGAQLTLAAAAPSCHLGWTTLAGIGAVESDHGRHDGSAVDPDGVARPTIVGPPLDGTAGNRAVTDTDGGRLDGDVTWDRAVGPLQFIPTTWAAWGRSATGGVPDPNQVDDAALTAASYLCAAGTDLATPAGWTAAVGTYNAPPEYAVAVADAANAYAARSRA